MLHEVISNQRNPLVRTDQSLNARPFALEPFLLACRLILGEVSDL
jgi:hypothetical protein